MDRLIAACLALSCLVLATESAALTIISHTGMNDPTTEGWTVTAGSPDNAVGGNEATGSGSHDYWKIDHTTGQSPNYGVSYLPTAEQLDYDWRVEMSVRVVDSPAHCCFVAPMPFTAVSVRDGLHTWSLLLGNGVVGVLDNAPAPHSNFSRSAAVDTQVDYHDYAIQFHRNGPGTADDTADYYYDGALLFAGVGRSELQAIGSTTVSWGPGARDQTSNANYERVVFSSVPEPASGLLAGLGLAALAGRRRR